MAPLLVVALAALLARAAVAHPMGDHEHVHSTRGLPYTHNEDLEHLFKRQQQGNYPPEDVPGPQPKQEWVTAYNTAVAAGMIPNFPPSVLANGWPAYAGNVDPNTICSWTVSKCTTGECVPPSLWGSRNDAERGNSVIDAPDGMAGISFDDGPQQPTATLLPFLRSINQTVTHFMVRRRFFCPSWVRH